MSPNITTHLEIDDFLQLRDQAIQVLGQQTARAVKVGLDAGAEHARSNFKHTRRTGRLTSKGELRGVVRKRHERGAWGYLQNTTPYARYVEFGTRPHVILPLDYHWGNKRAQRPTSRVTGKRVSVAAGAGRGSALRFVVGGKTIFARRVNHPGTAAQPFMEPASIVAGERIIHEIESNGFVQVAALWD